MTIKVIQDGRLYFAFRGIYKHIGEKIYLFGLTINQ